MSSFSSSLLQNRLLGRGSCIKRYLDPEQCLHPIYREKISLPCPKGVSFSSTNCLEYKDWTQAGGEAPEWWWVRFCREALPAGSLPPDVPYTLAPCGGTHKCCLHTRPPSLHPSCCLGICPYCNYTFEKSMYYSLYRYPKSTLPPSFGDKIQMHAHMTWIFPSNVVILHLLVVLSNLQQ